MPKTSNSLSLMYGKMSWLIDAIKSRKRVFTSSFLVFCYYIASELKSLLFLNFEYSDIITSVFTKSKLFFFKTLSQADNKPSISSLFDV